MTMTKTHLALSMSRHFRFGALPHKAGGPETKLTQKCSPFEGNWADIAPSRSRASNRRWIHGTARAMAPEVKIDKTQAAPNQIDPTTPRKATVEIDLQPLRNCGCARLKNKL
jgi:hypothetical protein